MRARDVIRLRHMLDAARLPFRGSAVARCIVISGRTAIPGICSKLHRFSSEGGRKRVDWPYKKQLHMASAELSISLYTKNRMPV